MELFSFRQFSVKFIIFYMIYLIKTINFINNTYLSNFRSTKILFLKENHNNIIMNMIYKNNNLLIILI